jgi:hypothetical protein
LSNSQAQGESRPIATSFVVLWRRPLVCVIKLGWSARAGASIALQFAGGRECHILATPSWRMADQLDEARELDQWLRREHPNAKLSVMTASEADAGLVSGRGVEAIWSSDAAFADERIYFPELDEPKIYDAVHNAQTKPFKRHELAHKVDNLALITFAEGDGPPVAEVVRGYPHLSYVNYSDRGGHQRLDSAAVRGVLSQARCGLLLSAVEGANRASMEYFLCGLPLVTTPSYGGRDEMYDPRHVTMVEPDARAVEAAVEAYRSNTPDPLAVRAGALARARPHRARLIAWLSGVVGHDLLQLADGNLWLPQFRDKLIHRWRLERQPEGGFQARPL